MKNSCVQKMFETVKDIYQKKASGVLSLKFAIGKRYIFFTDGEISYAQSEIEGERLGNFLIKYNYLSEEELDVALSYSKWENKKLGQYLIDTLQLTSEDVEYSVLDVVNSIVSSLFKEECTALKFMEGNIKGASETFITISTGDILINSVRGLKYDAIFLEFYNKTKNLKPQICAKTHDIYNSLRINPEEGYLFSRVDGISTVTEIEKLTGFSSEKTARMIFGLTLLGIIEFKEEIKLESQHNIEKKVKKNVEEVIKEEPEKVVKEEVNKVIKEEPENVATNENKLINENAVIEEKEKEKVRIGTYSISNKKVDIKKINDKPKETKTIKEEKRESILTDEELKFVEEVKALYKSLEKTDYYKLLGLPINANSKEIKKAYMEKVKKFHPDKYAHTKFGNLGNMLDKLFAEISTANTVLSDDKKRREYEIKELNIKKIKEDSYFGRKVRILVDEGRKFLERGELDFAESSIEKALIYDSENPNLYIELGKIQMEFDDMLDNATKNFSKALKLDPAATESYICLAKLALKLGDLEKAEKHFNNLLSFDPENPDALEFFKNKKKGGVLGAMKNWFS